MADGEQRPEGSRDTDELSGAAVLDAIPHPAFVLTTDGCVQQANTAARWLLDGGEPDTVDTLARPAHRERVCEAVAAAAGGTATTVEIDTDAIEGTHRLALDCSPIEQSRGLAGVLAVGRPIESDPGGSGPPAHEGENPDDGRTDAPTTGDPGSAGRTGDDPEEADDTHEAAFANNATDTELLLHSGTTTELVFRVRGRNCFLATLSDEAGPVGLRWTVPEDDGLRHYLEVEATAAETVAGAEAAGARAATVVSERVTDDEPTTTIVEAVPRESVAARLSDVGAVVQEGHAEGGIAEFTARIAGRTDTRTAVEAFQDEFDAALKAKRRVEEPVETAQDLRRTAAERLTDRQSEVLRTAYLMGYFEWPRVHNAEEVAERMDITSATLHYHLRAAERNFLELFFDESPTSG